MAKVTYLIGMKKTILEVPIGSSIAEFGINNGLEIQHACGLNCRCTTCACKIEAGSDLLSEKMEHEQERLDLKGIIDNTRLSCQCVVVEDGNIKVRFDGTDLKDDDEKGETVFI